MTDQTTILIVEDERIVAEDICQVLIQQGFSVSGIVSTGKAAITASRKTNPDLILMDIKLKGDMGGIEAARQIMELYQIPVIYLTAHADIATLNKAKVTGPYGYLVKPFHERELKSSIEVALYKHAMEMKLRESEIRFRGLFETMNQGVCTLNRDLLIQSVNPAAEKILGAPAKELKGMDLLDPVWETITEDFNICQRGDHPADQALQGQIVENQVMGIRTRQGTEKWLLINAAPLSARKGGSENVLLSFTDISRSRRLELDMKRRNAQLADLNRMSSVLSSTLDFHELMIKALGEVVKIGECRAGSLVLMNKNGKIISLHFSGIKADNRKDLKIWHENPSRSHLSLLRSGRTGILPLPDGPFHQAMAITFHLNGQMGAIHLFRDEDHPFHEDDIHLYSSIGQHIQLTFRNAQLYEETRGTLEILKETQDRLIRSERLAGLGAMAGSVVHEIGNSLGAISNSVQVLNRRLDLQGPMKELMDIIIVESQRLNQSVNHLREFARPRMIQKEPGDFRQLVKHAVTVIQQDVDLVKDRQILVDLPAELETIWFDGNAMEQVLLNLIKNALQAVSDGEPVNIRVRSHGSRDGGIICEVQDRGMGVAAEDIDNLFEPYFTTKSKGMGLGLHIARQIVEDHGGHIRIQSQKRKGTIVTVSLPNERNIDGQHSHRR